jgi:alpha-L-fucosidase
MRPPKLLAGFGFLLLLGPDGLAQTAGVDEEAIDKVWQEANRKYDRPRRELVEAVDRQAASGPFRPHWKSLAEVPVAGWYEDAKFGIFIHWGLYSVPAFANEWYPRNLYQAGSPEFSHHVATHGPQAKFGYKDFIPLWKAERFDARAWARLFREAGARYVVPVAEHHDGFPIYDSKLTDWCAGKMGPKRDLLGELARAIREEGLYLGVSSHRAEHDWFFEGGRLVDSDVSDPKLAALYGPAHPRLVRPGCDHNLIEDWTFVSPAFADDWLARTAEIVEKVQPDLVYFDWWVGHPAFRGHLARFAAYHYNKAAQAGRQAVINYKDHAFQEGAAILDVERGQMADIQPRPWQTDTSISNASWAYLPNDTYKSPEVLVHQLVDVVSKNGNLLLNVTPRADGIMPDEVQTILREVGAWLAVNGEAIYGTRPWKHFGEGPTQVAGGAFQDSKSKPFTARDFRFTSKGATIYAIELGWPTSKSVRIRSLGERELGKGKIRKVSLLGAAAALKWSQGSDGLRLELPARRPGNYAHAFRIEIQ